MATTTRPQLSHEFTKGDTEQYTLNPPPAKQPKLSPSHIRMYHPSQPQPSPSPPHPSQPYHPHLHNFSQPHPHPNLDTYNFEEFKMHLPHSQPPPPPMRRVECSPPPPTKQVKRSPPPPTKQVRHSPPPPTKQVRHSPPPPVRLSPFLLFVSFLRDFYDSEVPLSFCKWPPVPKNIYINLAAISRENVTSTELKQFMLATLHGDVDQILKKKAPIKIQDILDRKAGETLHCVLVEGAPGVGKTVLSWEICTRWARGELFQQYSVVMLLRLRDRTVQNADCIMDFIQYMYVIEDEDLIKISQHIEQTKGKDTLIILEGLDDLPKHLLNTDQPSIFTRLLSRKTLANATILVTSRPSATVQLRNGWKISRHIAVLGFTAMDITDYIHNALSPQELSAFDSYLSTNPNIRLTMYIPLNCAIVVEVYRSCQQSARPPPKTTTELYTCLVQTILLRYLDSHSQYKDDAIDVDKFTDLPPPVYHHFCKLIQMAYEGVQSQQLTFHDQHTTIEHLGFMDVVLELFLRPTMHTVTYSYNFLHLSLQEFLAAYYISLQSIDVQQQLLRTVHKEGHLKNMGRFLAGITKYQGMDRATVKAIIEQECKKGFGGRLVLFPYTLQLLHESGDYSIIDGHPSYSCHFTDYNPLQDFVALGHCIANSSYKWKLTLGDRGQYMQSADRIEILVQTLKSNSNPSYTIEEITCYYDTPECAQLVLLELPQYALQQIQTLVLQSNSRNPQPLPQCVLEHISSEMSSLHKLWLINGAVSTNGAIAIADLIKSNNMYALKELNLRGNNIRALDEIREIKKDLTLILPSTQIQMKEQMKLLPLIPYIMPDALHTLPKSHIKFIDPLEIIHCNSSGGIYHNPLHGITLRIPEGAIPHGEHLEISIGVGLYGDFSFPNGLSPVSAIVWLCSETETIFLKPIQVILPHFMNCKSKEDAKSFKIQFMKANHWSSASEATRFLPADGEVDFTSFLDKGILHTQHLCYLCISSEVSPEQIRKRRFCITCAIPRQITTGSSVYFYVHYFLKTCIQSVEKQLPEGYSIQKEKLFKFSDETISGEYQSSAVHRPVTLTLGPKRISQEMLDFWKLHQSGELALMEERKLYPPSMQLTFGNLSLCEEQVVTVLFRGTQEPVEQMMIEIIVPGSKVQSARPTPTLKDMPTMRQLLQLKTVPEEAPLRIIETLALQWEDLGLMIDFDPVGRRVALIKSDCSVEGSVACCKKVLTDWLRGEGGYQPPTWENLLKILDDIDYSILATTLRNYILTD